LAFAGNRLAGSPEVSSTLDHTVRTTHAASHRAEFFTLPRMALLRDLAYTLALIVLAPWLIGKAWTTGKYRRGWRGRLGHANLAPDPYRPTVLLHAVSVGEVNALRGLVQRLETWHGEQLRLVISTTTDTGIDRARELFGNRHPVVRFPLDLSPCVRRFLDRVQPEAVALVELEVWPNFATACRARGIPLLVVNGRLSDRSFGRYRRLRPVVRSMFRALALAAVQDDVYAERFVALGTPPQRVTVTGNMKWDNAVIADDVPGSAALGAAMGIDPHRPLIVCGSTGPGEERMLRDALDPLRDARGRPVQVLMAPRKPERFDHAAAALPEAVRRSAHPDGQVLERSGERRWFLLDAMGDLAKAYALADVVIVGRSFCRLYGSNLIDPIALGKATIIGPNTADFADMVRRFLAGRGVIQLSGIGPLTTVVGELLADADKARALAERGRAVIRANQGATARHADLIAERVFPAGEPPSSP